MKRAVWLWVLWLGGCSAEAGSVEDDPMSVGENQNGTTGGEEVVAEGPTLPPLPDTYVWCAVSDGSACVATIAALGGIPIKHSESAPPQLFVLEDTYDDCHASGADELRRRLERALGLSPTSWGDQSGSALEASQFENMYAASGCIAQSPVGATVKFAASSTSDPRTYLVRVWEAGSAYY